MTTDLAISILTNAGYTLKEKKRLGNNLGDQVVFVTGEIVNVFDKGSSLTPKAPVGSSRR